MAWFIKTMYLNKHLEGLKESFFYRAKVYCSFGDLFACIKEISKVVIYELEIYFTHQQIAF